MGAGLGGRFEAVRFVHCGDVIGVYEPLVAQTGDEVREPRVRPSPTSPNTGRSSTTASALQR